MNTDHIYHLIELFIMSGIAWKIVQAVNNQVKSSNRVLDALRDFPLHRHVGNKVIYPADYQPPPIEEIPTNGNRK